MGVPLPRSASPPALSLSTLERALADRWQRGLPLVPRPFAAIGASLGATEDEVLGALASMSARGVLSRVGPVFRPGALGASTLAAMAVPNDRLDDVARLVSARPEVNHNYEREHRLNLWFVVTASDPGHLRATLDDIARASGRPVLSLPLVEAYHIDLGFALHHGESTGADEGRSGRATGTARVHPGDATGALAAGMPGGRARFGTRQKGCGTFASDVPGARAADSAARATDGVLIAAIQDGLRLESRPFRAAAAAAGISERSIIARLGDWIGDGTIRRLGLVLHHRTLGYHANAMVVWDVPDAAVAPLGAKLAHEPAVTLCYRRARALPAWRYNLYCMLHGRERTAVADRIADLVRRHRIEQHPREVLFSRTAYKQRGAHYRFAAQAGAPAGG